VAAEPCLIVTAPIKFTPRDFIGDDPQLLKEVTNPNTNIILVKRTADDDLKGYLQSIQDKTLVRAPNPGQQLVREQQFVFANGKRAMWYLPKAIDGKGVEFFVRDLTDACNQFIKAVPSVTFESDNMGGASAIRFLSAEQALIDRARVVNSPRADKVSFSSSTH